LETQGIAPVRGVKIEYLNYLEQYFYCNS
jgi:hypothetical protein